MKMESLISILLLLKFVINSDEWLVVTGADEPVYAHAGEDVTLSCSVDTHVNVRELQVEWRKTDDDIIVLQYIDGMNRPGFQHERYSGRAEFFTEEIPNGNFSMKLRKVRMEDKGEFMCEVHSDTSNSTTARIAALGYSSLHWLILGLCIAVTPVVLLTGALSFWHLIRGDESKQALLSHWTLVTVPPIMVFAAFILWGVTEGSLAETITCAAISLLSILLLFNIAQHRLYTAKSGGNLYLAWKIGSTILIIAITTVFTVSVKEFLTKKSATPAGRAILEDFVYVFIAMMVLVAVMQFFFLWILYKYIFVSWKTLKVRKLYVFLIIVVLLAIGLGVFLAIYVPGRAETGMVLTVCLVPMLMILIPFVVSGISVIYYLCSPAEKQLPRKIALFYLLISLNMLVNIQILNLYVQLIASMQNKLFLGYFIPITVASLGIFACIFAKVFLHSFRHFYLAQKSLLGIFFTLHLILSFLYLSVILENDEGRLVKICEFVFIYILTATNNHDWHRNKHLAKPRECVYFSGAFGLPLVNSVALAVALKLKADTGKQPLDLRPIVLISGSVYLFGCFVIQMCTLCFDKKEKIKEVFTHFQRPKDSKPDQEKHKHIQELMHADECLWEKLIDEEMWLCLRPLCCTMRKVLKHITHCQAGTSCQVEYCASSQEIISKWEKKGYRWFFQEKNKHMKELIHADKCLWEKLTQEDMWLCSRPQCSTMRKVLKHMAHCQAGTSCQVEHCASSQEIISKWEKKGYRWFFREKTKLMKELIHADKCLWEKPTQEDTWSCSMPQCSTMRKVLKHMAHCQAGTSCQEEYCASSQEIISKWEKKGYRWFFREKNKHMKELMHADECLWEKLTHEDTCSRPQCRTMRKVLKHIDNCQAGTSCQVEHCASSQEIISKWEKKGYDWFFRGLQENQEMKGLSPADHNEPNAEEVLLGEKNTEG